MCIRDSEITKAVHDVFSFLTAYAENPSYGPLLVAPLDLAEKCMSLIEREAEHARMGRPASIIAKFNSLLDENIVQSLYRASQAGVEIELIVRGIDVYKRQRGHRSNGRPVLATRATRVSPDRFGSWRGRSATSN